MIEHSITHCIKLLVSNSNGVNSNLTAVSTAEIKYI